MEYLNYASQQELEELLLVFIDSRNAGYSLPGAGIENKILQIAEHLSKYNKSVEFMRNVVINYRDMDFLNHYIKSKLIM